MEDVEAILKRYSFEVDDEIQCKLCGKIPVKPMTAPCACLFCFDCIREFLENGEGKCPGSQDDCHLTNLSMNRDIHPDRRLTKKIPTLVVKCPFDLCPERCELKDMVKHLEMCEKNRVNCVFSVVGCDRVDVVKENLETHLNEDHKKHAELLVEFLRNMENRMDALGKCVEEEKTKRRKVEDELKVEKDKRARLESIQERLVSVSERQAALKREMDQDKASLTRRLMSVECTLKQHSDDIQTLKSDPNFSDVQVAFEDESVDDESLAYSSSDRQSFLNDSNIASDYESDDHISEFY